MKRWEGFQLGTPLTHSLLEKLDYTQVQLGLNLIWN